MSGSTQNFSWVSDTIAASGAPASRKQVRWLRRNGISGILSLTADPLPSEWIEGAEIQYLHLPIGDHGVPDTQTLDAGVRFLESHSNRNEKVLVHCSAGLGRTGTMLAAYVMKTRRCGATEAVRFIRSLRPGSVESKQEDSLRKYEAKSLKSSSGGSG